jgi:hypothetical protein
MTMPTIDDVFREVFRVRLMLDALSSERIATPEAIRDPKADAVVRFDPKTWRGGGSFKGRPMSQCPAEFLDELAGALSAIAQKEDREKKLYKGGPASRFTRRDAARARRWAIEARVSASVAADADEPATTSPTETHSGTTSAPAASASTTWEDPDGAGAWADDDVDEHEDGGDDDDRF